ncbi:AAA family ATPase [Gilvimarinus sp. F26214L]|uniref:AAA family ATPase n=1 Tax=Gilvimarinus sp. DZF01 TaxID=3461371 RepID=UPI0040467209
MQNSLDRIISQIGTVLLGKDEAVKLSLACLLARGHLLIEDLPGMGKTTLAHALANALGLTYRRVQFTSDMLPADILGFSVFDRDNNRFNFHPGPVFSQVLLADEINRSTPKTQSALLEAMEERQVTLEGETRPLPQPFFVIATQNPNSQSGTFPLPESQLDRFLMRIQLGYPDKRAERALLMGVDPRSRLEDMQACLSFQEFGELQGQVDTVNASDSLLDYLQRLVDYTRTGPEFSCGLSPRGALALLRSAKAWALIEGRDYLIPEDVQAVAPAVVGHRVQDGGNFGDRNGLGMVERLLNNVDVMGA